MNTESTSNKNDKLTPIQAWCVRHGVSRSTGRRWESQGIIQTTNICGRRYVTAEAEEEFRQRAERGEFAKLSPIEAHSQRCANATAATDETPRLEVAAA